MRQTPAFSTAVVMLALGAGQLSAQDVSAKTVKAVTGRVAITQDRNFTAEQISRETRTLAVGATGTLELKNLSGNITVTAGGGKEATIEIVKRAKGRTDADAKDGLQKVTVEVDQRSERATVQTRYPQDVRRPNYSVSVDYTVTAPAGARVVAESIAGDVTLKGIRGDIQASVTSGDISITGAGMAVIAKTISGDVTLTGGDPDATVELGSVSGNVTAQDVKAHRLAITVTSGDIKAQGVSADSAELTSTVGTVEYTGTLAKSGRYDLRSHAGEVIFNPAGNVGYELTANTFSGQIQSNVTTKNPLSPGTRRGGVARGPSSREAHGTVGDGSAVVNLSTFSGNIIVGKK